jgi:phospholipase C
MFETRRVVLQGSILSAALALAGTLPGSGCAGDTGPVGVKGDPGAPGGQGPAGGTGSQGPAGGTGSQGPGGGLGSQGPGGGPGFQCPFVPAGAGVGIHDPAADVTTDTPIKHLVIIFGENVSFDHYFGTYPTAKNLAGETGFKGTAPAQGVNNLATPLDVNNHFMPISNPTLLTANPNKIQDPNNTSAMITANPIRLTPAQASTADQGHNYKPEQQASHGGAMDLFPQFTGAANLSPLPSLNDKGLVMGYYDGNTVTAMWNYAQHFAMSDNSWTTVFGPSTPGALNLISGQTSGMINPPANKPFTMFSASHVVADGQGGFTMIGDTDPANDVCSTSSETNLMAGKNIGDLLNAKNITWGAFMGGFDLNLTNANGTFGCNRLTNASQLPFTGPSVDYIPHHAWFQYYASTANPTHARPSSLQAIGSSTATGGGAEPANHNYDSHDFFDALSVGNLPAVSFVKAPAFQDGHAGYSNPVDEQAFDICVVNALQESKFWASTAVIIAYDDSDGWYDHQAPPILNPSSDPDSQAKPSVDQLNGAGLCNNANAQQGITPGAALLGTDANGNPTAAAVNGRCGYGTRVPLLVLSPFAKPNFVDHTLTDQSSVLKFIEDNWLGGQRIQDGASFDTIAGTIESMFSFPSTPPPSALAASRTLKLDPRTGLEAAK